MLRLGLRLFSLAHLQLPREPPAFQTHLSPLLIWKNQPLVGRFRPGLRSCSPNISSFLMLDSQSFCISNCCLGHRSSVPKLPKKMDSNFIPVVEKLLDHDQKPDQAAPFGTMIKVYSQPKRFPTLTFLLSLLIYKMKPEVKG